MKVHWLSLISAARGCLSWETISFHNAFLIGRRRHQEHIWFVSSLVFPLWIIKKMAPKNSIESEMIISYFGLIYLRWWFLFLGLFSRGGCLEPMKVLFVTIWVGSHFTLDPPDSQPILAKQRGCLRWVRWWVGNALLSSHRSVAKRAHHLGNAGHREIWLVHEFLVFEDTAFSFLQHENVQWHLRWV